MTACREVVALVASRRDGPLAPEQRARLDEHVASCVACAHVVRDERRMVHALARLRDERRSLRLPPASRLEASARAAALGARARRRRVTLALAAGVGAIVLSAAALVVPRLGSDAPERAASAAPPAATPPPLIWSNGSVEVVAPPGALVSTSSSTEPRTTVAVHVVEEWDL